MLSCFHILNLKENISINQFGFRENHSTELAVTTITEEIKRSIDDGNFACGIFLDLKKLLIQ